MVPKPPSKSWPPGRQGIPTNVLDTYKRERVARAVAEIVHETGTDGLTVALITKRARMARATFYELFGSREEALEFSIELGSTRLRKAIENPLGAMTWEGRIGATIESLLAAAEAAPHLSELSLLYGWNPGEQPHGPFDRRLVETLAGAIRAGRQGASKPSPGARTEELLTYGVLWIVAERLRRGDGDSLQELGRELTEFVLLPFLDRRSLGSLAGLPQQH